jgi:cytochrome c peroxidase
MPFNHPLVFAIVISTLSIAACGGSSGGGSDDAAGGAAGSSMVALGKALFFDEDLSSNGNQSCGSCHDPVAGFADPDATVAAPVSAGSLSPATFGNRNAPTAAYASLIPSFVKLHTTTVDGTDSNFQGGQFLDGRRNTLAEQAKDPFLNPAEMNNVDEEDVVGKVQNASYADDFREIFGANAFNDTLQAYDNIAAAIAAFETSREMNPFTSKFDAVMAAGSTIDFTDSELRGFELFKGTKAKCANCHTVDDPAIGSLFTDFNYYNIGTPKNPANPVYGVDPAFKDGGLGDRPDLTVAERAAEKGKFRVPTLRNIELTAPYMHNGVYKDLKEVTTHYDIQVANEFITPEVDVNIANELDAGGFVGLGLQPRDYIDLEQFMLTLTDGFM